MILEMIQVKTLTANAALNEKFLANPLKPEPTGPGGQIDQKLTTVMNFVAWGATILCVVGVIIAGVQMALKHQRGEPPSAALGWAVAGAVVVAFAGPLVTFVTG